MAKGRRDISAEDRAIFWQAMQSGVTVREAARMAGISYETALKWRAKSKQTAGEIEIAKLEGVNPHSGHMLKKDLAIHRGKKDLPQDIALVSTYIGLRLLDLQQLLNRLRSYSKV